MDDDEIEVFDCLDRITSLLMVRAEQMGVCGFSIRGEVLELQDALDHEGPLVWALFMHSEILSKMTGVRGMPFECVLDSSALFGNKPNIIKRASLPLSFAKLFLDAALEHAIVTGIKVIDCSSEEWFELTDDVRVLAVEDYIQDLGDNWLPVENLPIIDKVVNWPVLLNFEALDDSLDMRNEAKPAEKMVVHGVMPFAPKQ